MLNYRHLYYFWMVAKEGGFSRAAERLDMAIQTISAQVRELERNLGHQLLAGRTRRGLTDAGQAAFARAEEIFQIGQGLAQEVRTAATKPVIRLSVACPTAFPSWPRTARPGAGHAGPAADLPRRRVRGTAGRTGAASPGSGAGRPGRARQSQPAPDQRPAGVLAGGLVWPVAPAARADVQAFPQSLERLPVLLPTGHSVLRQTLDRWFREQGIHPNVVGEFEDSALMSVFAARGLGVFPLSRLGGDDIGLLRPAALARATRSTRRSTLSAIAGDRTIPWCDASWSRPRLRFS